MKSNKLYNIRRSNRRKIARLEKAGYVFSEDYKNYVRYAKGRITRSNMVAEAYVTPNGIRENKVLKLNNKNKWQEKRAKAMIVEIEYKMEALKKGSKNRDEIKNKIKDRIDLLMSGNISTSEPNKEFRRVDEAWGGAFSRWDEAHGKHADKYDDPELYYDWLYTQRNYGRFVEILKQSGAPEDLIKLIDDDVMMRLNNLDNTTLYEVLASDQPTGVISNKSIILNDIFGKDLLDSYVDKYNDWWTAGGVSFFEEAWI